MQAGVSATVLVVTALAAHASEETKAGAMDNIKAWLMDLLGPGVVMIALGALLTAGMALQKLDRLEQSDAEMKREIGDVKELIERKAALITGRVSILGSVLFVVVAVPVTLGVQDAFGKVLSRLGS